MGISVEFNPDLTLRNYDKCLAGERKPEECLPEKLDVGKVYNFLKFGQRNYWLEGEIPLLITDGKNLSLPIAGIIILECVHFSDNGSIYTRGKYLVKEIFDPAESVHFNGFKRI